MKELREVEINGGRVERSGDEHWLMKLPRVREGYADAQLDDYAGRRRSRYPWRPGTELSLDARFSHAETALVGTAGFGFWNAPFGPGTGPLPALPAAVWFFYASEPTNLPLAMPGEVGRGWFAATVDATTWRALAWAPLAPAVLLLNQVPAVYRRLWPLVRHSLAISFTRLDTDMTAWHSYSLSWQAKGCRFLVDGKLRSETPFSPTGPLGFVAWIDNQYLRATPTGRFGWGTVPIRTPQWLEIRDLRLASDR